MEGRPPQPLQVLESDSLVTSPDPSPRCWDRVDLGPWRASLPPWELQVEEEETKKISEIGWKGVNDKGKHIALTAHFHHLKVFD